MPNVLILDGQQRSALAVTRSLGQKGIKVHVADSRLPTLAGRSRFAVSETLSPDPQQDASAFSAWVIDTIQRLQTDVVIPITDLSTMLLAPLQGQLGTTKVASAPAMAYELVSDKARLMQLAEFIGVPIPSTVVFSNKEELREHVNSCAYPVVLKPARSRLLLHNAITSTSVCIANCPAEALTYINEQRWIEIMPCLVQQYIAGFGAGIFTFYWDGQPVTWFAHKRIREKPPSGGVSVLSESAPVSQVLKDHASKLLGAANWNGLAMVEFKISDDGTAYLMEINGRPWGSIQLAIDSGIDFPWLLYQAATSNACNTTDVYTCGNRLRWMLGDLDNLLLQLRSEDYGLAEKANAAARFVQSFFDRACRQEVFRWSDPNPALHETRQWLVDLVR